MRANRWWGGILVAAAASIVVLGGCTSIRPPGLDSGGSTMPALPPLDRTKVARGKQVYMRNCASCHGPRAEGAQNWQQPDARGDLPPPPHDDRGHTWRHSDAQLAEIIRNGLRDPFNKTPELTMPPFKERLTDQDIQAVITYFKSLWSSEHRAYQEEQNRRPPMSTREPSR